MNTEVIDISGAIDQLHRLVRDRDQLLAALKAMTTMYDGLDDALIHQGVKDKVRAARAAIADAEQTEGSK